MTRFYYLQIGVLALFLAALIGGSIFLFANQAGTLLSTNESCGCTVAALPWWSWILTIAAAGFLALVAYHVITTLTAQIHFHTTLAVQRIALPESLRLRAARHRIRLQLISADHMEAFTTGFVKPRVVVSTALLEKLSGQELEAVLAHEARHARAYHPLLTFILTIAQKVLLLPRAVVEYLRFLAEREADNAALRFANVRVLAAALVKVLRDEPQAVPVTVHAFSTTTLRVKKLLHEPLGIPRSMFWMQSGLLVLGLAVVTAVVGLFLMSSEVHAATGEMCTILPYCAKQTLQSIPAVTALPLQMNIPALLTIAP